MITDVCTVVALVVVELTAALADGVGVGIEAPAPDESDEMVVEGAGVVVVVPSVVGAGVVVDGDFGVDEGFLVDGVGVGVGVTLISRFA